MTLGELEAMLAAPLGVEAVANLPTSAQNRLRHVVRRALGRVYAPENGRRPKWGEVHRGYHLRAPETVTLSLTKGSKVFTATGYSFVEATDVGAVISIGGGGARFFGYAGKDSQETPADNLVEPWPEATGSYSATVYFPSVTLEDDVIGVVGDPQVVNIGPLYPIEGEDAQTMIRAYWYTDFNKLHNHYRSFEFPRRTFERGSEYDVGDPYFYFVDDAAFSPLSGSSYSVSRRLFVYPIPDISLTVRLRVNIVPSPPASSPESWVIPMPPGLSDSAFYPVAREEMANEFEDYPVASAQGLATEADRGRKQLANANQTQRARKPHLRPKCGW